MPTVRSPSAWPVSRTLSFENVHLRWRSACCTAVEHLQHYPCETTTSLSEGRTLFPQNSSKQPVAKNEIKLHDVINVK